MYTVMRKKNKQDGTDTINNSVSIKKSRKRQVVGIWDKQNEWRIGTRREGTGLWIAPPRRDRMQGESGRGDKVYEVSEMTPLMRMVRRVPDVLYHGTSSENLEDIRMNGLGRYIIKDGMSGRVKLPPKVWLAEDKEAAVGSGSGVVLRINTAGLDRAKLKNSKEKDPLYYGGNVWIYEGKISPQFIEVCQR